MKKRISITTLAITMAMMIALLFSALSLTAGAVDTAATGIWGEYVPDTNTYTYADFSPFSTNSGKDGSAEAPYEISTPNQLAALAALVNRHGSATVLTDINGTTATPSDFSGKYIKLSADIDISGKQWITIGIDSSQKVFRGNFDGAGHTVSGLSIESTAIHCAGLFGYVTEGTVKNVGVSGEINITLSTGNAYVGGLVGYAYFNTIENCYSTCNLNGSGVNSCVGGLAGHASFSTITNSYNTGSISGTGHTNANAGGLVGHASVSTITNSYNTGSISGTGHPNATAGGLVGTASSATTITNCYNTGSVSGNDSYVGGVVGYNDGGTAENCYYLSDSETDNIDGTTVKDAAQFASGEVAYLLGSEVWGQTLGDNGDDYPVFKTENNTVYRNILGGCTESSYTYEYSNTQKAPVYTHDAFDENGFCTECDDYQPATDSDGDGYYEIDNAGKLYWFAALVNGTLTDGTAQNKSANAILTKDIVVNEGVLTEMAKNSPDPSGFRPWIPIGKGANGYTGTFNGQNYTVSGLYFNDSAADRVGLFGYVYTNGKVQNVGVIDSYIHGRYDVGGVVGFNNGTVDNCYNEGSVSGTESRVGGVVGDTLGGTVTNNYNKGTVSGSSKVGGVLGHNSYGTVSDCYNTGDVIGTDKSVAATEQYVGGVVGQNEGGEMGGNFYGTVSNCYNTGNVIGTDYYIGGVVGQNKGGTVSDSYNIGNISGNGNVGSNNQYVGGVVGYNDGGTVQNSYNEGTVSGISSVGGVVGENAGTVDNCYNEGTVSGTFYIGGVVGYN